MKRGCVLAFSMWLAAAPAVRAFGVSGAADPAAAEQGLDPVTEQSADPVTSALAEASVATQRDRHGRLRAPVFIDGRGPFNLIVDTGANGSAISPGVAQTLGLERNRLVDVLLRGVTGSSKVHAVAVESIALGGLSMPSAPLPIVADALDGADGFLGTGAFADQRVFIDFRRGRIAISGSRPSGDTKGFVQVPADLSRARLVAVDTRVNGIAVRAILDTGAGGTVGNSAMRVLLADARGGGRGSAGGGGSSADRSAQGGDRIVGTTAAVEIGATYPMPPIALGALLFAGARVSFADAAIFSYLDLSEKPALLIGMDVLGQLDSMIIDYGSRTLKLRPPEQRTARFRSAR
jgi:predicted aspartyl protease